ncbi:hypothetical protein [Amycolatopsis sp. NPDC051716]|uniref:hypothetical protein n=1 Tax=Amycolatopsis sp. NPDC051716 TaxID=3155804 RepID=UPI003446FC64
MRVEYGDATLPVSPGAGGSMQTASIANSLLSACEKLKRELDKLAKRSGSAGWPGS